MDLAALQLVARELNSVLAGGFINKIHQPLPREIVLRVRIPAGGERKIFVSADPQLGRIHLTALKIPNPPSPPRFCAYLRAHLQGARILSVEAAADDRVVTVRTVKGPRESPLLQDLILELLGRDSNILLVSAETGRILDCLHHIPAKETGSRPVLPGEAYAPPPQPPGRAATVRPEKEKAFPSPGISTLATGKARLMVHAVPGQDACFPTMNEAADTFFGSRLSAALLEAFRRECAAPLKSRIRSLDRRLDKIRLDAKRLNELLSRSEEGELLKANLHRIKKGMTSIEVPDWQSGGMRSIRLDPALGPVANMERIFTKAAKGKRGASFVRTRLDETAEERRALQDALYFIESAETMEELEREAQEAGPQGQPKQSTDSAGRRPRQEQKTPSIAEFSAPSGNKVLVGKSARGNDLLLRTKSGKQDLWLHVKDFPGAHVLLVGSGAAAPAEADVDFAAGLAVRHSKARERGKTEVMVAEIKDVHRVKGPMPGRVTVRHYTTVLADGSEVE